MEISEIFSKNLIHFRKLKSLSQRELAEKTKLTQRIINYYENNPQSVPFSNLKTLADTLDVDISAFFDKHKLGNNDLFNSIDIRWIKKIFAIKKLPAEEQKEINRHIKYLLTKNKSEIEK